MELYLQHVQGSLVPFQNSKINLMHKPHKVTKSIFNTVMQFISSIIHQKSHTEMGQ